MSTLLGNPQSFDCCMVSLILLEPVLFTVVFCWRFWLSLLGNTPGIRKRLKPLYRPSAQSLVKHDACDEPLAIAGSAWRTWKTAAACSCLAVLSGQGVRRPLECAWARARGLSTCRLATWEMPPPVQRHRLMQGMLCASGNAVAPKFCIVCMIQKVSIDPSINQSVTQSINQSINQASKQANKQASKQSACKPGNHRQAAENASLYIYKLSITIHAQTVQRCNLQQKDKVRTRFEELTPLDPQLRGGSCNARGQTPMLS